MLARRISRLAKLFGHCDYHTSGTASWFPHGQERRLFQFALQILN